jgi:hypothetical protein
VIDHSSAVVSVPRGSYRPQSWIDAVVGWIERRGISWWLVFVVVFVGWGLVFNVIRWVEGTTTFPELDRVTLDVLFVALPIPAYGLLTSAAGRALQRFLPALDEPAERSARSLRRLTAMPLWQSIVVLAVGAAIGFGNYSSEPSYWPVYGTSTAMFVAGIVLGFGFGYGATIVVFWQAIRIVAEVVSLNRRAVVVDLDRPGPTHAFAPVTAGAASFLIIVISYAAATDPTTLTNAGSIALAISSIVIAIAIFLLPLLEMRARLIHVKQQTLDDRGRRMRATVDELERAIDDRRFADVAPLQTSVGALTDRVDRVKRASTWPWDTRVVSGFATTLLIPVATWLITTYAGRFVDL